MSKQEQDWTSLLMVFGEAHLREHTLTLESHAPSNRHTDPQTIYRKREQIKKRAYEQRIREI